MPGKVESGDTPSGLLWARSGDWRIVACPEGGWSRQRRVAGLCWCLLGEGEMPADVEAALLAALGLSE